MLDRHEAVLVVIDMQEPFLKQIFERERVVDKVVKLIRAARILEVPVLATLQYADRMGDVIPEVAEALPEGEHIDKRTFSCCGVEAFPARLESTGRKQVMVCGVEGHICVSQTAHDLLARGYQVHVVRDAISARRETDRETGVGKMTASGAVLSSFETAVYELLRDSTAPEFKAILDLVK
jgi:nicotinamidase-related amidase